jgi:hypothetical protein
VVALNASKAAAKMQCQVLRVLLNKVMVYGEVASNLACMAFSITQKRS